MILYTFQEIMQNKQKSKTGQGFEFASVFGISTKKWLLRPKILYKGFTIVHSYWHIKVFHYKI